MKKLGQIIGKVVDGSKKSAKTTATASKSALSATKEAMVNAKADFVAGYKEQTNAVVPKISDDSADSK